ncbi:MAG: type II toxin-antitoxin system HicB family antitoxin [Synergistaceae bacterium]|nr:type II toxin-antitoxin system HicB family antitoxin [Synergistaceae bacterium]
MDKYTKIISWSDDDNKFLVEVPELPGCMADGATPEEALKNSEVIIAEWLETAEILGREIHRYNENLIYA